MNYAALGGGGGVLTASSQYAPATAPQLHQGHGPQPGPDEGASAEAKAYCPIG
jgi:hypothetical protein